MEKIKNLIKQLESGKLAPFVQFVKFGLVGVCNTAIQWGGNQLGYYVLFKSLPEQPRVVLGVTLGFILCVINSYFWNNKFVFKSGLKKTVGEHAWAFFKMTLSYAFTTLLLTWLITTWIKGMGTPYWIASLVPLIVTVPLNFFLNKLWVFRNKKEETEDETDPS